MSEHVVHTWQLKGDGHLEYIGPCDESPIRPSVGDRVLGEDGSVLSPEQVKQLLDA